MEVLAFCLFFGQQLSSYIHHSSKEELWLKLSKTKVSLANVRDQSNQACTAATSSLMILVAKRSKLRIQTNER